MLVEDVTEKEPPKEWAVFERSQNGDFFGRPLAYITENGRYTTDIATHIEHAIDFANTLRIEIERISNGEIRQIGWELNQLRLEKRKQELNQSLTDEYIQQHNERKRVLTSLLFESEAKLELLRSRLRGGSTCLLRI